MKKNKVLIYLALIVLGILLSSIVTRSDFNTKTIALIIFFAIFIPTLINPDIGLMVIIIAIFFSPEVMTGSTTSRAVVIRIEDVFLGVVILAWFVRTAFTKDITSAFKTGLTVPFFLYLTACVISTVFALLFKETDLQELDIKQSFFTILKYGEYFLLFAMVRDNMKSLRQSKIFISTFLLVALLVAVHSNSFIARELEQGKNFFRVGPPVIAGRGAGETGTLGGYLLFMMAVAGGILLYTRSVPARVFLICLELLMLRAFFYTLSRGSYLAFIPMAAVLIWSAKNKRILLIWAVIAMIFILPIFMPQMIRDRIATTITTKEGMSGTYVEWEASPEARLESWRHIIFEEFPKRPLFGAGVARAFTDGQIFLMLFETGIAGLVLFLWVLARLFKMARDNLGLDSVREDNFSLGVTTGFIAGFLGLLVQSLSTNTFIIIKIMEPFWFIAAIVLALPALLEREKQPQPELRYGR